MIFKRIGAKKHKYQLKVTLSTIKYCPWDSASDHHAESPQYTLYKGRCNLNNNELTLPCTMYFNQQKYLAKQAEIKIKSFNKQKKELGSTLSKIKFDLIKYTQEDRPYEEQLQFDAAKLSCSIQMKMVDDDALTEETNSHLSIKTQKIAKERNKTKQRSKSQEKNTYQFGKSNRVITEQDEKQIKQGKKGKIQRKRSKIGEQQHGDKQKKRKQSQDVDLFSSHKKDKQRQVIVQQKLKNRSSNPIQQQTKQERNETSYKEKDKDKDNNKERTKDKDRDRDKQRTQQRIRQKELDTNQKQRQKDEQTVKDNPSDGSGKKAPHESLELFSPFYKQPTSKSSQAREYMYRQQLDQKSQLLNKMQQQNQNLKKLLEARLNSQPIEAKQSISKISHLQEQNQKLRQKLVEKQIMLSEYQIKLKTAKQREIQLQQGRKQSTIQARNLREQLQIVKNKIADALTNALDSGDTTLIDFIEEHFSSE